MATDESPEEKAKRRAAIEQALQVHEQRIAEPYDGVLGILPDWVPEWHKARFAEIRRRLLDAGYTRDQIVRYIDEWQNLHCGVAVTSYSIPIEIENDIDALATYRNTVSRGATEGLMHLAGKVAVIGREDQKRRSTGGVKSGKKRSTKKADRDRTIAAYVKSLRVGGHDRGEWAGMAAKKFCCSDDTARNAIKNAGLYDAHKTLKKK